MGPNVDKIFLELAGRPVIAHTWQRFADSPSITDIVLVVRSGMEAAFHDLAAAFHLAKPYQLVAGGAERQDSVWNGLSAAGSNTEVVAIQDGARPCTSERLIAATIEAAWRSGAAVAARTITDTIKESADGHTVLRTLDRSRLWSVQTPQAFRRDVLLRALDEVRRRGLRVTDDTAACELTGQPVQLVSSTDPNPKVTRPEDLPYIQWLLRSLA